MSPSEPLGGSPPTGKAPPEVLAIAVALAVAWRQAEAETPEGPATEAPRSPWQWSGRRWERSASYRWS